MRFVLLALLVPALMPAQAPLVSPGSRVRVMKLSEHERRRVGEVAAISGDSAVILFKTSPPSTGTFALERLERWNGTRTRRPEGMVVGAVAGVALGFVLSNALAPTSCNDWCFNRAEVQGKVVPAFSIAFLFIGGFIGSHYKADRWTPIVP